jgi:excisionase family DNA binding protein
MSPLRSVKQTAELCGISPWTVRSYIRQGKLRPIRIGRRVLFDEQELERFIGMAARPVPCSQNSGGEGSRAEVRSDTNIGSGNGSAGRATRVENCRNFN